MPRKHSDNSEDANKLIRTILPRLKGKKTATKVGAIRDLAALGKHASHVADRLFGFIDSTDEVVRSEAMRAIAEIGLGDKTVCRSVRELLKNTGNNEDPYLRCRIYWILEHIEST